MKYAFLIMGFLVLSTSALSQDTKEISKSNGQQDSKPSTDDEELSKKIKAALVDIFEDPKNPASDPKGVFKFYFKFLERKQGLLDKIIVERDPLKVDDLKYDIEDLDEAWNTREDGPQIQMDYIVLISNINTYLNSEENTDRLAEEFPKKWKALNDKLNELQVKFKEAKSVDQRVAYGKKIRHLRAVFVRAHIGSVLD